MKSPGLSKRLAAILALIDAPNEKFADIGTDHAHLPIAAVFSGAASSAIACDLNPGPLKIAAENIAAHQLTERIETRLGFGLTPLRPREVSTIVIAGMGGMNIIEILTESPEIVAACETLILQPQRDLLKVRSVLVHMDFFMAEEISVEDRGRSYKIIFARNAKKQNRPAV